MILFPANKVLLTLAVCIVLLPSPLFAQDKFGSNSDIVGLKLSMSRDEAIKFLKTNFNVVDSKELKQQIQTNDYKTPEILLGYELTIITKGEQDQNKAQTKNEKENEKVAAAIGVRPGLRQNEFASDKIKIALDPTDENRILAITRTRNFNPDDMPLANVFYNTFIEKYGKPKKDSDRGVPLNGGVENGVWSDKVWPTTDQNLDFRCYWALGLVEDMHLQITSLMKEISTNSSNLKDVDRCGTAMDLRDISYAKNGEYVGRFKQRIANISQTIISIKQFQADLIAKSETAKRNRVNSDSQKKPQL